MGGKSHSPNYGRRMANEVSSINFWRDVLSEVVATFFLVSVQCAVPLNWGDTTNHAGIIQVALAMGFVVSVLIEAFGDIGGAHMNPAVTVSMAVSNQVTILRACLYILAQCAGAIAGAGFVYGVTPDIHRSSLARTHVADGLAQWKGMFVELWLTFILVQTIWGATNKKRRRVFSPSIPIGLAVSLDILTGAFYTGASMNPARSLGPALVTNVWEDQWVYWVGPILGGLLATLVYHFFLDKVGSSELPDDAETQYLQSVFIDSFEQRRSPSNGKSGV